jgi:hypothetical protein
VTRIVRGPDRDNLLLDRGIGGKEGDRVGDTPEALSKKFVIAFISVAPLSA